MCGSGECAGKGLTRGRLEYALRTKVGDAEWAEVVSSIEALSASS